MNRTVQRGAHEGALGVIDHALGQERPSSTLERLRGEGWLADALPEVEALVGFHESCRVHHKDLWAHTLAVIDRLGPDTDLRWAALMHDTGKVETRCIDDRGRVTFYGHEAAGAAEMQRVGERLGMSAGRRDKIAFVIAHHGWVNAYGRAWSDGAVRRLVHLAGPRLGDLLAFSRADYTTQRRGQAARIEGRLAHLDQRIERLAEQAQRPRLPPDLGRVVMEHLGIPAGPAVGDHLRWLAAELLAGRLPAGAKPDAYLEALDRRSPDRG